jgi:acyl-CoA synthetase (AMP-forming)/AMP-acid ligase II
MNNIGELIVLNANRYPDKTALVYRDLRLSYRKLNERINRMAHHLLDLGVQKGEQVGFMFYNSNQFVEIFYATLKIGALAVPVNFRMVPREVKWMLDNSRCKVFAYSEECKAQVDPVKNDFSTVEHLIFSGKEASSGEHDFESFTQEGIKEEPEAIVGPEDRAYILYTGGTTGLPKGAVITHGGALFNCMSQMIRNNVMSPDETVITQIPMFHSGGIAQINPCLAVGGKIVVVEKFDARKILELIQRERATWLVLFPPASFLRLMDVPNLNEYDTGSVKKIVSSVAAFPKSVMLKILDNFPNATILFGYAQTETGNLGTLDWFSRSMIEQDLDIIKGVGREHSLVEIRLVDEQGQEVPIGETGEAIVKSAANMKEYFEQPELTARTIKNGWVYTGDLLRKDKDGYFYFMGRSKDMIKTGGENVFAQEVEKVILSHPAVENCAVIGLPDPKLGEAVTAVVKLRQGLTATEGEIMEHCKTTISSYKKPRRVVFVDVFPVTDAGKVQKFRLVKQYSEPE